MYIDIIETACEQQHQPSRQWAFVKLQHRLIVSLSVWHSWLLRNVPSKNSFFYWNCNLLIFHLFFAAAGWEAPKDGWAMPRYHRCQPWQCHRCPRCQRCHRYHRFLDCERPAPPKELRVPRALQMQALRVLWVVAMMTTSRGILGMGLCLRMTELYTTFRAAAMKVQTQKRVYIFIYFDFHLSPLLCNSSLGLLKVYVELFRDSLLARNVWAVTKRFTHFVVFVS